MMRSLIWVWIWGMVSLAGGQEKEEEKGPEQPNIIWLMAEDMGCDLACYGMAGVKTPHLDQMAREGVRYTRVYCDNPICSPNRSSMMVGVPSTEIAAHQHRSRREAPLAAPYRPITSILRESGYTCLLGHSEVLGAGGKVDCNFQHRNIGDYDGETQFGLFDRREDFSAAAQPFFSQIQLKVTHRGDWWNTTRAESQHPVSLEAIELPPYLADTPEIRYDWATYLDTVEAMDHEVGLIMADLREQGLDQNTVVIFMGDNGRCHVRGKGYLYEPGIRVPMIVWAPGIVEPGSVVEELICTTDISATVLKLAGATIPDYLTSPPFLRVDQPSYRSYVRSSRDAWDEIDDCSRSITTKTHKYIKNHMPEVPWEAGQAYLDLNRPAVHIMRKLKREGKLSEEALAFFRDQKPEEELYDLAADPHEMVNLAGDPAHAEVLAELRAIEAAHQESHRDHGLEDLRNRTLAPVRSTQARAHVRAEYPELWQRLEQGELMETGQWLKKYGAISGVRPERAP